MTFPILFAATLLTSAPWQIFETQDGGAPWSFAAKDADIAEGGWVTVNFTVSWKDIVRERPFYAWSGVVFAAKAFDPEGKPLFLKTKNFGDGNHPESPGKMRFLLPKNSHKFTISFGPMFAKGSFALRGVSVELAGLNAKYPSIPLRGRSYEYDERGKEPSNPAKLPADEAFGLFRVDSPRKTFDRFAPEQSALCNSFSFMAAPGETADLFIGIYASRDVSVSAAVDAAFRRKDSGRPLGAAPDVFRAHNRPHTGGYGQTYWIVPEVLMPIASMPEVKAGRSALTMLQFKIPPDAAPGEYSGTVAFTGGGERRTADISIHVLPFKVAFPAPATHQTILHVSWYADDPEILKQVVRDAKSRGCESMLIACQYGKGRIELERRDGRLAIKSFNRFDHALAAFKAAGMAGTLYVHFSDKLEVAVAKAIGVAMPDGGGEQTNMVPEMEGDAFKAAQVEALRLVRERAGGVRIAVLAMDEPDNGKRLPRAQWEVDRIREAGITSALYAGARSYDLTHPDIILGGGLVPGIPKYDHFREEVEKHGAVFCRYGGTGSYGYAFGGLMPSRILHGWGEFLTPESKGHTIWTVQVNKPYAPDSIDHLSSYGTVYQRADDGRLLSTLQLEGCYEGMLDYAYLKELERRLAAKAGSETAKRISAAFELMKKEMWNVVPYRLDADLSLDPEKLAKRAFSNTDAVEARKKVAQWICELD